MVSYFIFRGCCSCFLTASLILPVFQLQIHSIWILAMHHLFVMIFIFLSIALENSIPCYLIPFSKQTDKMPFGIFLQTTRKPLFQYILCPPEQPSIRPLLCFLSPFSQSGLSLFDFSPGGPVVAASALPGVLSSLTRTLSHFV